MGESPAVVAHRDAPALDIDTLVPGVRNRAGLVECDTTAEAGPLPADLMARLDAAVKAACLA